MGRPAKVRVVAAFRDGEHARRALRDLEAMGIDDMRVRLVGPEELMEARAPGASPFPAALAAAGGDWSWAGVEKQWLNHVLLRLDGVPPDAVPEVTRTLRQDGAEHVSVG